MAGGASELDFIWDIRTLVQTNLDLMTVLLPETKVNRCDTTVFRNPEKTTKVAANALLTFHSLVLGWNWDH